MTPNQFLELIVSASVQAALIIAVTHWIAKLTTRGETASQLWSGCFLALLLTVFAGTLLPHIRIARPWTNVDAGVAAAAANWQIQAGFWVFTIWITGVGIAIILFAWQLIYLHRFVRSCDEIDLCDIIDDADAIELERSARFKLLVTNHSPSPFCWQLHTASIVFPQSILSLSSHELLLILKHEAEHLRTGHPLQLFVQRMTEAIFWFHPMVWWASHQAALVREFACDDAAVTSKNEIAGYLRTLLKVIEMGTGESNGSPTPLAFGRDSGSVARRARRLVAIAQSNVQHRPWLPPEMTQVLLFAGSTAVIAFFWLPIDALASPKSSWSPWPKWSANVLHDIGIHVRDYEVFDSRSQLYELELDAGLPQHDRRPDEALSH